MKIALFLVFLISGSASFSETTTSDSNSAPQSVNLNVASRTYGLATSCQNFIHPNGDLGTWGEALIDGIERSGTKCFYEDIDFSYLCPKYSTFTIQRKNQFLAFLFAVIAHYEASCRLRARAHGVNDIAVGLFQLEDTKYWRNQAGRPSPQCSPDRAVSDTYALSFQMPCVTAMFSRQYCNSGLDPGRHSSYWHKLNPSSRGGDRAITSTVKKFPYCN